MQRWLVLAGIVTALLGGAPAAHAASYEFTDWSSRDNLTTFGTLQGHDVVLTSPESVGGNVFDGTSPQFNTSQFNPQLPASDQIEIRGRNGNSYTLNFGGPVKDPVFHLYSLASTIAFPSGTTVTKVSGDDTFTASGNTAAGVADGSADSSGTIRVNGTFDSLTVTATPTFGDGSMADGISMQVGVKLATPPPTTTISLTPVEPAPEGYYPFFVFAQVAATGDPDGTPFETRCVLDPPSAPASFDALPAGCPYVDTSSVQVVGVHTLYAASRNATGEAEAPVVSRTFRVEAPPDTTITGAPQGSVWTPAPQFAFRGGETYECRLDGAAFAPCASPFTAPVLNQGPHAFQVRAINERGIPDPTPAGVDFGINETQLKELSCEQRRISVDWFMFTFDKPNRLGCAIGTLGDQGCPRELTCVVKDQPCPLGARCVLNVRAEWFDADIETKWGAVAIATYGPIIPLDTIPRRRYPRQQGYCQTTFDGDRCVALSRLTSLGDGSPISPTCGESLDFGSGVLGATAFRDDDVRRIECSAELLIEPARPLTIVAPGVLLGFLTTQVSAPGAGTMSLAASIILGGSAAKKKGPRIASQSKNVKAAGPVSFRLKPNAAAKRLLKRKKKLRVKLQVTFKPADGAAPTVKTERVTLRQPKPAPKRCTKRSRRKGCR